MKTFSFFRNAKFFLRQAVNMESIQGTFSIFSKPALILPDFTVTHISKLDISKLKAMGVKCLIFDKDNTLSITYEDRPHHSIVDTLHKLVQEFPSNSIAILSNSVGTIDDAEYKNAVATESAFKIPVIRHKKKKPGCYDEVLNFFEKKLESELHPYEICMIGDRVLTDVLFANQNGMISVLVDPLTILKDHPVAVLFRFIERNILLPFVQLLGFKPIQTQHFR